MEGGLITFIQLKLNHYQFLNIYQMKGGMFIGIFDNKQKKKKVNKKKNVQEKKELSFY